MSNRRPRTSQRGPRRAINKQLRTVQILAVVAAKRECIIKAAATWPATITGLRWEFNIARTIDTGALGPTSTLRWVIAVVPDGSTSGTPNMATTGKTYTPEQNCLAFGSFSSSGISVVPAGVSHQVGSTKTMRKIRAGDQLMVVVMGTAVEAHEITGTVQWFEKS